MNQHKVFFKPGRSERGRLPFRQSVDDVRRLEGLLQEAPEDGRQVDDEEEEEAVAA